MPPPAVVVELVSHRRRIIERADDIPVLIRRILLPFPQVLEGEEVAPRMVENAVDDDLHPAAVRLPHHSQKKPVRRRPLPGGGAARFLLDQGEITRRVRPEIRVDVVVGIAVVLVHRARVEKRIEIQRVHPEVLQVTEFVEHSLQVAAVTPVKDALVKSGPHRLLPGGAPVPVRRPRGDSPVRSRLDRRFQRGPGRIVLRVAVAESFGENLVPDRGASPLGRLFGRGRFGAAASGRSQRQNRQQEGENACSHAG